MPASNIKTVKLLPGGQVNIIGEFTNVAQYDLALLHIWLAQPGAPGQPGFGLAQDAKPAYNAATGSFNATYPSATGKGFIEGPATVSAIAVLTPKPDAKPEAHGPVVAEVIQWSRTLTLAEVEHHVGLTTF